jgi:hypothetical protein
MQPLRDIAMHLDSNFAAPPLRLRHAGEGNEFGVGVFV